MECTIIHQTRPPKTTHLTTQKNHLHSNHHRLVFGRLRHYFWHRPCCHVVGFALCQHLTAQLLVRGPPGKPPRKPPKTQTKKNKNKTQRPSHPKEPPTYSITVAYVAGFHFESAVERWSPLKDLKSSTLIKNSTAWFHNPEIIDSSWMPESCLRFRRPHKKSLSHGLIAWNSLTFLRCK